MFCPRAGNSLQSQEPRLQFCRKQVFHRKLGKQNWMIEPLFNNKRQIPAICSCTFNFPIVSTKEIFVFERRVPVVSLFPCRPLWFHLRSTVSIITSLSLDTADRPPAAMLAYVNRDKGNITRLLFKQKCSLQLRKAQFISPEFITYNCELCINTLHIYCIRFNSHILKLYFSGTDKTLRINTNYAEQSYL